MIATTNTEGEPVLRSEIYVDLNNSKGPNKFGRDLFMFTRSDKGFLPYGYNQNAAALDSECSKTGNGNTCGAKIAKDGWEIKDNYPW